MYVLDEVLTKLSFAYRKVLMFLKNNLHRLRCIVGVRTPTITSKYYKNNLNIVKKAIKPVIIL